MLLGKIIIFCHAYQRKSHLFNIKKKTMSDTFILKATFKKYNITFLLFFVIFDRQDDPTAIICGRVKREGGGKKRANPTGHRP